MIARVLSAERQALAREYPVVTILGPRQSGKTTLAKIAFPGHRYVDLEEPETRIEATPETMGALDVIVREGARKMLQAALEAEIEEHLCRFKDLVDEDGSTTS